MIRKQMIIGHRTEEYKFLLNKEVMQLESKGFKESRMLNKTLVAL